jgi:hypothetical protein
VVLVELAGVKAEEIDISVEGKTLTVRGERSDRQRHLTRLYHQMEIVAASSSGLWLFPARWTLSGPAPPTPTASWPSFCPRCSSNWRAAYA